MLSWPCAFQWKVRPLPLWDWRRKSPLKEFVFVDLKPFWPLLCIGDVDLRCKALGPAGDGSPCSLEMKIQEQLPTRCVPYLPLKKSKKQGDLSTERAQAAGPAASELGKRVVQSIL